MKKILNILLVSLTILVFSSCKDDVDNPYSVKSNISVIESNIAFQAKASKGYVRIKADGPVTATAASKWCKAIVSGDSVAVTVDENDDLNGRSSLLTIKSGNDSVDVAVHQSGLIFQLSAGSSLALGDNDSIYQYYMKHNVDVEIISAPDWAKVETTADSLKINVAANDMGHFRTGYVKYKAGTYTDFIKVTQCDFDKDLAGNYYLAYTNNKGKLAATSVVLDQNSITISALNLKMSSSYDATSNSLSVKCGQYIGEYTPYYVYLMFGDTAGAYWTGYSNTTSASIANFDYNDDDGTIAYFGGSFGNSQIGSFILEAFSSNSLTEDADYTTLVNMTSPFLLKMSDTSAKQNYNFQSKEQLKFVLRK